MPGMQRKHNKSNSFETFLSVLHQQQEKARRRSVRASSPRTAERTGAWEESRHAWRDALRSSEGRYGRDGACVPGERDRHDGYGSSRMPTARFANVS